MKYLIYIFLIICAYGPTASEHPEFPPPYLNGPKGPVA